MENPERCNSAQHTQTACLGSLPRLELVRRFDCVGRVGFGLICWDIRR